MVVVVDVVFDGYVYVDLDEQALTTRPGSLRVNERNDQVHVDVAVNVQVNVHVKVDDPNRPRRRL